MGIGLAVVLVVGAVGGWMFLRANEDEKEPIVVGSTSTATMIDPGGAYDAGSWALMSNLYQSLLTFAEGQDQPVPDAAESCEFRGEDLLTYRCVLRDDLVFSNGREVTAEDVKFSFDRILAMAARADREAVDDTIPEEEKFTYSGPGPLLTTLEVVRTEGRNVIFELNQPDATFPFVLAGSTGAIVDQESYERTEPRTDGEVVGSGPFLLADYQDQEFAELVPNPDYRGAQEVPEFPVTVRYFTQPDPEGRPAEQLLADAWEAGEIDVNDGRMPPEVMADINLADPDFRVSDTSSGATRVMAFNTREGAPMAVKELRQAAAALLDRGAISRRIHSGTVEPLYSLIPVGFTGHSTPYFDLYQGTDVEALREDLEQDGVELPVSFHLAYSRGAANHAEAALVEQQLERGGIFDVEIQYYEWTEFIPIVTGNDPFDAYLAGWRADFPDPATFTDSLLGEGDSLNTGFLNRTINQQITELQAEPDRGQTAQDFEEIHELAAGLAPVIPLWQEKRIVIGQNDITGVQPLASNGGVWRMWELRRT